jgi:hypothetical protein
MISTGPHPLDLQRITRPLPEPSALDFTIHVSVRTVPGIAMSHRLQRGHRTLVETTEALAVTVSEAWATGEPLIVVRLTLANIALTRAVVNDELLFTSRVSRKACAHSLSRRLG